MNSFEAMASRADGQQFKQFQATSEVVAEGQKRLPYAIVERKDGILYAAGPLGDSQPVTPAYPGATVGDIVSVRGDVANG
jgi:hypothetical protein